MNILKKYFNQFSTFIVGAFIVMFWTFLSLSGLYLLTHGMAKELKQIISEDSVLFELTKIDYIQLVRLAILLVPLLFLTWTVIAVTLVLLKEIKILAPSQFAKIAIFTQKLAVASYPTLLLASVLNENTFSLVTNFISFFAIFTFVFKQSFGYDEV